MKQTQKNIKLLFFGLFFLMIAIVGVGTLRSHHTKSTLEGRALTTFPALSEFVRDPQAAIEQSNEAYSDQLTFRNAMIQLYNAMTLYGLHQTYTSDVVVGNHDEMFQAPTFITDPKENQEVLDRCAEMINSQAQAVLDMGIPFIFISYPQKDVVMREDVPWYYPDTQRVYQENMTYLRSKLAVGIQVIDGETLFRNAQGNKFYYTQDHHTNIYGQQLVYEALIKTMQENYPTLPMYGLDDYKIENSVVQGAFNRKLGNIIQSEPEALYLTPETFTYTYTRYEDDVISELPLMKQTGAYTAYMSGDFGKTRIVRNDIENAPKVLISGSSFTNALEYLLIPDVKELLSIDYRHNTSGLALKEYVEQERPDYVIFVPSQSTGSFLDYMYQQHLGLSDVRENE